MDVGGPTFVVPSIPSGGPWISVQPDIYRTRWFPQAHDVYLGSGLPKQLCCVRRFEEHGFHECLFVGSYGFVRSNLSHELVVATISDAPDHDPFLVLLKAEKPECSWHRAVGPCLPDIKAHILGLEASLGPRRALSIGVVCGLPNEQREEEMFDARLLSELHLAFLSSLGEEIHAGSWNYFGQDFITSTKKGTAYYTCFYGFEILFHVAPLLSPDEQRQYIGNDKVIIYCLEEGDEPFVPRFRGQVNSVAIVCQKKKDGEGWSVAVFCRERVLFNPPLPGREVSLAALRKVALTCAINGQYAVLASPPYDAMFGRAIQTYLRSIWSTSEGKEERKPDEKTKANRRFSFGKAQVSSGGSLDSIPAFSGFRLFSQQNSLTPVGSGSKHAKSLSSIFGRQLADIPPFGHDQIPWFLQECVRYFAESPQYMRREGLFRVTGSRSSLLRIQNMFTMDFVGPLSNDEDPFVVASALKSFFSELVDPIIPSSQWDALLTITESRYFDIEDAQLLMRELPEQHVRVLAHLFEFLATVASFSADNKMSATNLGMMFGIILIRSPGDSVKSQISSMPQEVCTFFIEHWYELFRSASQNVHTSNDEEEISSTFDNSE